MNTVAQTWNSLTNRQKAAFADNAIIGSPQRSFDAWFKDYDLLSPFKQKCVSQKIEYIVWLSKFN